MTLSTLPPRTVNLILFSLYAVALFFSAFYFTGTGDSGDSVMHYLFAKEAPNHPELFFDHWAKPVYVILCSSFAQLGFIGVKLFNVLAQLLTLYFVYRIAKALAIPRPQLAGIFILFAPLNYVLTFSGLTEILFASWLAAFLFFELVQNKSKTAAILISFLPFVRSEGWIVLIVVVVYYLWQKRYTLLPWLLIGHAVLSLLGFIVHKDLLWIFTKNPYTNVASYGTGTWNHFIDQLPYVVGIPICFLLIAGLIEILLKPIYRTNSSVVILIAGIFLAYFSAHSIFWTMGWFHSLGMKRVLLGVMPCVAIVALIGFNGIVTLLPSTGVYRKVTVGVVLTVVLIFPFIGNHASVHWKTEMNLTAEQMQCVEIAKLFNQYKSASSTLYCAPPYLIETTQLDYFDSKQHVLPSIANLKQLKRGDVVVWDSWFAPKELGLSKEGILNDYHLRLLCEFKNPESGETSFLVFRKD